MPHTLYFVGWPNMPVVSGSRLLPPAVRSLLLTCVEAEILSLIMPALNTAGGIPPLDTFRRALTNAIGCPLTGDVNKLGFKLLTQSICIIQR